MDRQLDRKILPLLPLPTIGQLFSALHTAEAPMANFLKPPQEGFAFYKGRQAIIGGLEAVARAYDSESLTVLLPDLYCYQTLQVIKASHEKVRLYPVRQDLSPDWPRLEKMLPACGSPTVFCVVDFFGFPNQQEPSRQFAREHRLVLLEDRAHTLLGADIDPPKYLAVYSPWKLLPVPFMGILFTSNELSPFVPRPRGSAPVINLAAWIAWRQLQRLMTALGVPWDSKAERISSHSEVAKVDNSASGLVRANFLARKMLRSLCPHLGAVAQVRRRNYLQLESCFQENKNVATVFDRLLPEVVPQVMPVLLKRGSSRVVAKLRAKGISARQWPYAVDDLLIEPEDHSVALDIWSKLMLLPIHQDINSKQIASMGKIVNRLTASG